MDGGGVVVRSCAEGENANNLNLAAADAIAAARMGDSGCSLVVGWGGVRLAE